MLRGLAFALLRGLVVTGAGSFPFPLSVPIPVPVVALVLLLWTPVAGFLFRSPVA